jgi:hypothetical protein
MTQHIEVTIGGVGPLRFVRRPVSEIPPDGTIAFLDGVNDEGRPRRGVGHFHDGQWWGSAGRQQLRFTPTLWTVMAAANG